MSYNINAAEFEIERMSNAIKTLTETLRLNELENQQLAQDKAELVEALNGVALIARSTPDKECKDITIGDVAVMDSSLQMIFDAASSLLEKHK